MALSHEQAIHRSLTDGFRQQVQGAMIARAKQILGVGDNPGEDAGTDNHQNRAALADLFVRTDTWDMVGRVYARVVSEEKAAAGDATTLPDTEVEAAVNALWDLFAGLDA